MLKQIGKPKPLTEADIQRACTDLLELDGWRALRTDPVSDAATVGAIRRAIMGCPALNHVRELLFGLIARCVRGKGFGEVGMADHLYIRYGLRVEVGSESEGRRIRDMVPPAAEVLWCEWKRKGGKAAAHQTAWHTLERARGALTLIAGTDFPATIEGFREFYKNSGLNRRAL